MASINVNDIAVREEAERLFRMKQEAERQAARQRELAKLAEIEELKRREVEIRLQRESEIMMARLRAEEEMAANKARAEKEAYDAAVAARLAALEARSPEEKMMAELEALRNQLEAKLSFLDTGYTTLTQKHVTFAESCPWKSELNEIKGLIAGLDKKFTQEVTSLRSLATKPARTIRFMADYNATNYIFQPASCHVAGQARTLSVTYTINPQGGSAHPTSKSVGEGQVFSVDVPAGHIVALVSARWTVTNTTHHHPAGGNDVSDKVRVYFDM